MTFQEVPFRAWRNWDRISRDEDPQGERDVYFTI